MSISCPGPQSAAQACQHSKPRREQALSIASQVGEAVDPEPQNLRFCPGVASLPGGGGIKNLKRHEPLSSPNKCGSAASTLTTTDLVKNL